MLGAMVMHLQGQLGPRLDLDALDLKTLTVVHRVITTPGPEHIAVQVDLGAFLSFMKTVHHLLHILGFVLVGDQHSV